MIEYRKASPAEREAYIELANYVFSHDHEPTDFEKLMPKVYGAEVESSSMHRVAVDEQGRLRSLVAVLPQTVTVGGDTLRAGFVGTVSVHPKARGEGHMKALMNAWLQELRETCDIAVLGGQRQRYEYFGFTGGGLQVKYIVTKTNVRHALAQVVTEGLSLCPLFEADGAEAFAHTINISRPAYVHRDKQHIPAILATYCQKALGVLEAGRLIGYLVTDAAGNSISELAMENPDDIARAVKACMSYMGKAQLSIYVPYYDRALNACLGSFAEHSSLESSEMYHIFDFAKVLKAYLSLKHRTLGLVPGEFSAVLDGQPVTARVDEGGVHVERTANQDAPILDKQQAQTLLLTSQGRYMDIPAPADWFPLPIFWYSVDTF